MVSWIAWNIRTRTGTPFGSTCFVLRNSHIGLMRDLFTVWLRSICYVMMWRRIMNSWGLNKFGLLTSWFTVWLWTKRYVTMLRWRIINGWWMNVTDRLRVWPMSTSWYTWRSTVWLWTVRYTRMMRRIMKGWWLNKRYVTMLRWRIINGWWMNVTDLLRVWPMSTSWYTWKQDVTPLPTQWSFVFLSLTHGFVHNEVQCPSSSQSCRITGSGVWRGHRRW